MSRSRVGSYDLQKVAAKIHILKAWIRAEVAIARKREKQFEKNVAELQQFIEHFRQQQGKIKVIVKMSLDKHKPFYDSRLKYFSRALFGSKLDFIHF